MAKGIFDALHHPAAQVRRGLVSGNGGPAHGQIREFRDGKDSHQDRHEVESLPEIHESHVKPERSGLPLLADGR